MQYPGCWSPRATKGRERLPGADVKPYLTPAADIAPALHGIRYEIQLSDPYEGDAHRPTDAKRVPESLEEAITAFAANDVAREAFGDPVRNLLLRTRRNELALLERIAAMVVLQWLKMVVL